MMPVSTQTAISQNGDCTLRAMSAETMKIPDPIIVPATSMVASVRVIALTKLDSAVAVSVPVAERLVLLLTHALRLRVGALHLCMSRAENSRECNAPRGARLDSRAARADVIPRVTLHCRVLRNGDYFVYLITKMLKESWIRKEPGCPPCRGSRRHWPGQRAGTAVPAGSRAPGRCSHDRELA